MESKRKTESRKYYLKNRDRIIAKVRAYRLKNADKIKRRVKAKMDSLSEEERDKIKKYQAEYRRKNKARILKYAREYREKFRKETNAKISAYRKTDKGRHGQKHKHFKRRALLKEARKLGSHTFTEWEKLLKENNGKCVHCDSLDDITVDHIIPLSKGGSNKIDNIQPLCRRCNCKKASKCE